MKLAAVMIAAAIALATFTNTTNAGPCRGGKCARPAAAKAAKAVGKVLRPRKNH